MTPNLRALLVFLGLSAGGVSVYLVRQGISAQQLRNEASDAGCVRRDFSCPFLWDGGYVYRSFPVGRCADDAGSAGFGFILGLRPEHLALIPGYPSLDAMAISCHRYAGQRTDAGLDPDAGIESMPDDTPDCICASDAGPCLLPDGGQLGAGTYAAGTATGVGCAARPCLEFSGYSAAPAGCAP
jgi:hypothetical protein